MPSSLPCFLQRRGRGRLVGEAGRQFGPYADGARRVAAVGFKARHMEIRPELIGEPLEGLAPYFLGFRCPSKAS
jgi:hypothetical protein